MPHPDLTTPFFSVIIPTYNRAHLIGQTIETVFRQGYQDYEVIVVDDGSTDDTPSALASYKDRIRVFTQPNAGPGVARNLGIQNARGRYVAFLDSDDFWFPWTLSTYAAVIEKYQTVSLITAKKPPFQDATQPTLNQSAVSLQAEYYRDWLDYYAGPACGSWIGLGGAVASAESLRRIGGFFEDRMNMEDLDLLMRLGTEPGYVQVLSPAVISLGRNDNNLTADPQKSYGGMCRLLDQERAGAYPGRSGRRRQRLKILTKLARNWSITFIRNRETGWARIIYKKSLPMQFRLLRFKYILGLPLLALMEKIRMSAQQ